MVRAAVSDQSAGDRKPGVVLERIRLHRAGDLVSGDAGDPGRPWLSALAGDAVRRHHQLDGHQHRRPDRVPPDLRDRLGRRHPAFARLYVGNHAAHARSLDRAFGGAGENRARDRADAGRPADAGQPMSVWPDDDVILFDGVCVFCSHWVRFVVARDKAVRFRFTPIQSPYGTRLALALGIDPNDPDTNAVIHDGIAHVKSDGALTVLSCLPGWSWVRVLFAV